MNALDVNYLTPLHLAVKAADVLKSTRTVRHLLIKGARRDLKDKFGRTALDIVNEDYYQNKSIQTELRLYLVSIVKQLKSNLISIVRSLIVAVLNAEDTFAKGIKEQEHGGFVSCTSIYQLRTDLHGNLVRCTYILDLRYPTAHIVSTFNLLLLLMLA